MLEKLFKILGIVPKWGNIPLPADKTLSEEEKKESPPVEEEKK